jgi:hypothetical protein
MGNKESNKNCICIQCEFLNSETDNCTEKDVKKCSEQNITECENFLVKDKLVHF